MRRTGRREDRGSMLLQIAIATAAAGFGAATIAGSARPAIDAAHAWTCTAARDAVGLAALAHLAATGSPPESLRDLIDGDRPLLVLPDHARLSDDGLGLAVDGWSLTLDPVDGAVSARCSAA